MPFCLALSFTRKTTKNNPFAQSHAHVETTHCTSKGLHGRSLDVAPVSGTLGAETAEDECQKQ